MAANTDAVRFDACARELARMVSSAGSDKQPSINAGRVAAVT
ncbi:hypothetical protein [Nannocystis pusilla]